MADDHKLQKTDEDIADETITSFLRLINKIQHDRRTPISFGGGAPLTLLEAEMCSLIHRQEGVSGTELSSILGVTRSATSQTISKLVTKKYVIQKMLDNNSKRKCLFLTKAGKRAAEGADLYRKKFHENVFNVSKRELQSFHRMIKKIEEFQTQSRRDLK